MKIRLNNVRLAFPALFEAKTVNGEGEPAFSASFILASDHPQLDEIRKAMDKMGAEKWGAKWPQVKKKSKPKTVWLCTMVTLKAITKVTQVTTSFQRVIKRVNNFRS